MKYVEIQKMRKQAAVTYGPLKEQTPAEKLDAAIAYTNGYGRKDTKLVDSLLLEHENRAPTWLPLLGRLPNGNVRQLKIRPSMANNAFSTDLHQAYAGLNSAITGKPYKPWSDAMAPIWTMSGKRLTKLSR